MRGVEVPEVRVLGPVVVAGSGGESGPPSVVTRTLLAALALAGPGGLSDARLADALWGVDGADRVRGLSVAVLRTRRWLTEHTDGRARIERRSTGYALAGVAVDAQRFTDLIISDEVEAALELWRGDPLADAVVHETLTPEVSRLQDLRRRAVTRLAKDLLLAGRPDDAVDAVRPLADADQLDEPAQALLVEALAAAGRQAEALRRHEQVRTRLRDELGVSPGAELRAALQRVLSDDEAEQPAGPSWVVPAQLPAAVGDFTGRIELLRRLDKLAGVHGDGRVPVVAATGTAGVGKTSLAVQWARRVADSYPDGQLFLNLNGYAATPALTPGQALESVLRTLGVPGAQIPDDVSARASLYRSRLAGRRVLVVLDDVNSAEQVRALLPGEPGCLVLVTSRDSLSGLVALDGARRIEIDLLDTDEALELLGKLLGAEQLAAQRDDAAMLVELCARLPLALRIAAATIGDRPIADYLDALRADRLGELDADGDAQASPRAHFEHSYERLADSSQRLFRLLGVVPGRDIDAYGAAALAGRPLPEVRRTLRRLVDASLITEHDRGRYSFHDLLRAYARERAGLDESVDAVDAAVRRLCDWQRAVAANAMDVIAPGRGDLGRPRSDLDLPPIIDYEQGWSWLEAERVNLLAGIDHAAGRHWHEHTWQITFLIGQYLRLGYLQDARRIDPLALQATRQLGDRRAEAAILSSSIAIRDSPHEGLARGRRALELSRAAGDTEIEARALNVVAVNCGRRGDFPGALEHYGEALRLLDREGDIGGIKAAVLLNLGVLCTRLGHHAEALAHLRGSLDAYRRLRDRRGEAGVLMAIGRVHGALGDDAAALPVLLDVLERHRALGNRTYETTALQYLGDAYLRTAEIGQAIECYRSALRQSEEAGHTEDECVSRNGLGRAYRASGASNRAMLEHERALALSEPIGMRYEQARAHQGIAAARHDLDEHDLAAPNWATALSIYTELGVPEADQLRAELADLDEVCRRDSLAGGPVVDL